MSNFVLVLLLENPAWALQPKAQFPLQISVDGAWAKSVTGTASSRSVIYAVVGSDSATLSALRFGQELTVYAARDTLQFLLTGTSQALALTARCVLDNTAVASTGDPFSVNSDPFTAGASARPSMPTGMNLTPTQMAGFLTGIGLENIRLLSDGERLRFFPNAQYAWRTGRIFGVFVEAGLNGRTVDETIGDEIQGLLQACNGKFASAKNASHEVGTVHMVRFATACEVGGSSSVINGTMIAGTQDVIVIEHIGDKEVAASVSEADDSVFNGLEKIYRQP